MAEHRETFGEDVGGKLLLLASMLAVFGIVALILMPLGAAFAPPPAPPAAADTANPGQDASPSVAPAEGDAAAASATPETPPPAAAPAGPPSIVGALMPGIIMLAVAGVLAALAGLFLGHAKARGEEAGAPQATPPH